MALIDKLTAIADEIRGKTSLSDAMTLDQMAIDIASVPPLSIGTVPSYVETEAQRVSGVVKGLQNGDNTLSFIAMSDTHLGSDAQSRASVLHASQAVNIIKRLVPIDFTVVLGDIVYGASSDSLETHLDNHMQVKRTLAIAQPTAILDGNHDANIYNPASYLTASELYKYQGRQNINVVKPTSEQDRNYFYFDIPSKKLRVICLNTSDLKGKDASYGNNGERISAVQYQWLVSALDMTGKTGWHVMILSHHPVHWSDIMTKVQNIIDAYIGGTSGSFTADSVTVSYNFSGKNAATFVGTFHGHTHNYISGKAGSKQFARMGTPNVCFDRNNEYGNSTYYPDATFREKYGETTTYTKTANSGKDTAFVVNTIDFENQLIYSTYYGSGYDRMLSYGAIVYYSITSNFTNVVSNNSVASVEKDKPYTATITAIDTATLKTIVVTMGGVDVTSSVYSDGVITIEKVTGDVVITAVAELPLAYKNLVPLSTNADGSIYNKGTGYKEGYRLNSSGTETALPGAACSGYMPYKYETIRAWGTTNSSGSTTGFYVALYDASFTKINVLAGSTIGTLEPFNGKYLWTINPADVNATAQSYLNQAFYIRVSMPNCAGADLIVTLNDDLEDPTDGENTSGGGATYTNWLPISTDENGNVFNGKGYETGKRFSSSGGTSDNSAYAITGFIPATKGDVIRLNSALWNSTTTHYSYMQIKVYDASKTAVYTGYASLANIISQGIAEYTTEADGTHVITLNSSNTTWASYYDKTAYIRLSVMASACADGIITVNEEIT